MHDPHAGKDTKEEGNQDDYEESDGEGEDSGSPIAFVVGHYCVLPSVVKVKSISCLKCILEKRRRGQMKTLIIRLKLGSGAADLALLWGSPLSRICLAIPAPTL